jgi:hypothetical protein
MPGRTTTARFLGGPHDGILKAANQDDTNKSTRAGGDVRPRVYDSRYGVEPESDRRIDMPDQQLNFADGGVAASKVPVEFVGDPTDGVNVARKALEDTQPSKEMAAAIAEAMRLALNILEELEPTDAEARSRAQSVRMALAALKTYVPPMQSVRAMRIPQSVRCVRVRSRAPRQRRVRRTKTTHGPPRPENPDEPPLTGRAAA